MMIGGIRRALLFASAGRYIIMATNLAATAIVARLLTPAEFGISVVGSSVFFVAEALRELGSATYIVQQAELTMEKTRTVFTITFIATIVIAALLAMAAVPLAHFYRTPNLARYIQVMTFSYAVGPFIYPVYALMSRELAFQKISIIDVSTAFLNAAVTVALILAGFSYMSLAWASVASSAAAATLTFYFWRDIRIFRPSLKHWRGVLAFGIYGSITGVIYRASESFAYLIFGRILSPRAVGLLQRAVLLSHFPERVVLAGIGAVALPMFSDHARQGYDLKRTYLDTIEYISVVQWPALLLLILLSEPIILIVLGPQWSEVIPLMQIMAAALLFDFATTLNYPILVAVGAVRHTALLAVAQVVVSLSVLTFAGRYGLHAIALGTLFVVPFNVAVSVVLVRVHVPFLWRELAAAMRKSAVTTGMFVIGPLTMVIACGSRANLSIGATLAAIGLGAVGWIGGLWLTDHPLLHELRRAALRLSGYARA
jgi:O-antigen/teichoic acid export membrane protein